MGWCRGDDDSELYVVVDSAADFYVWYRLLQSMAQLSYILKMKCAYISVLRGCCTELAEELDELINT